MYEFLSILYFQFYIVKFVGPRGSINKMYRNRETTSKKEKQLNNQQVMKTSVSCATYQFKLSERP